MMYIATPTSGYVPNNDSDSKKLESSSAYVGHDPEEPTIELPFLPCAFYNRLESKAQSSNGSSNRGTTEEVFFDHSQLSTAVRVKDVYIGSYMTLVTTYDDPCALYKYNHKPTVDESGALAPFYKAEFLGKPITSEITSVSVGYSHQMVLCKWSNELFICGSASNGRLEVDHDLDKFALFNHKRFNPNNLPITIAKCGGIHSMIVLDNRLLYMTGWGGYGQHGQGTLEDVRLFSLANPNFEPHERIKIVAAGSAHTIVVTEENIVYGCGCNEEKMLGVGGGHALTTLTKLTFHEVFRGRSIEQVECGYRSTLFRLNTNEVYYMGHNSYKEAGYDSVWPDAPTQIMFPALNLAREVSISCSLYATCICLDRHKSYLAGKVADSSTAQATFTRIALPRALMRASVKTICSFSGVAAFEISNTTKQLEQFFAGLSQSISRCRFTDLEVLFA